MPAVLLLTSTAVAKHLDYLEIGTATVQTLSDSRPGAGASVDMVREYVETLQSRAGQGSGKVFLNAAIILMKLHSLQYHTG